jgi:hypothetical protein
MDSPTPRSRAPSRPSSIALVLFAAACGSQSAASRPSDGGGAAGGGDQDSADASADGASHASDVEADVASDAGADAAACGHELGNPACWAAADIAALTGGVMAYFGAVFDGRDVYLINGETAPDAGPGPGLQDPQLRLDTQATFTSPASYVSYDSGALLAASGFLGGAFDGRHVYYVPHAAAADQVAVRFDTAAAGFDDASSWSAFDLTTGGGADAVDATVPGFRGGAFDGRYVYFVPGATGTAASGRVFRHDTTADLAAAASWSSFDVTTVDAGAAGFFGAAFDGRYVYLVPHGVMPALVARYDTQAPFGSPGSWATFDAASLDPDAGAYVGAVFDGRYLYLVPNLAYPGMFASLATRYDTRAPFTSSGSWTTFDTRLADTDGARDHRRFNGGAFDGRYVYLLPQGGLEPLLRFDTQQGFTSPRSWSPVDPSRFSPGASGFAGAAFDGRYLYLVPSGVGQLLRFDAHTPAELPAAYSGSFL